MNKLIVIIILILIASGAVFAIRKIYFSPQEPAPAPIMPLISDEQLSTQPSSATSSKPTPTSVTIPPSVIKPINPPVVPQNVLDRIEAAIRAKLKR